MAGMCCMSKDGNTDLDAIAKAIAEAKTVTDKPTMIKVTTTIGYGSPNKQGTADAHGSVLGPDEIKLTRDNLGWEYEPFVVPDDALAHLRQAVDRGASLEAEWNETWAQYKTKYARRKQRNSIGCSAASCPTAGTKPCPPTSPKTSSWLPANTPKLA